jgi:Cu+-exporting ATPase
MEHHDVTPGAETTVDPVCGMTVEPTSAAASRLHEGTTYYFCSTYCAEEFDANPEQFVKP